MDPLSFFAAQNEAEQAKSPSEFEVDERRRESIRMSRTSNDIGGLVGVGFSISSTSKRNSCDRKSKSDRIDNSGNRNSTPKPTSALPTPPRVQPKESKKNENENENTEKEDIPSLDTYVSMLSGETTIIKLPDVIIQLYQTKLVPGTLFMTTYRLSFLPSPAHLASIGASNPSVYAMFNVPLSSIDKIEREKKQSKPQSILITCKDMRQHRIFLKGKVDPKTAETILSDDEIERAYSAMYRYAFPNNIRYVFAFSSSIPPSLRDTYSPAQPFNMEQEFSRQGVFNDHHGRPSNWRLSTENSTFKLCDSYPKLLVVPAGIDDVQLHNVAGFRSGHRFPALSYFHSNNGASIWRSSQPKAGVSGSNSVDELYLDLIARSTASRLSPTGEVRKGTPLLFIIDCRPKSSALANRAAGAGYEVSNNYPNTKIEFFNIGNIHVMRDSLKSMSNIFATNLSTAGDTSFGKVVEEAGWLTHVRLVLKASWDCAMSVVQGVPVLVHCSHGWDRTSQVLCLAQVLLDPYFRTFDGFAALVEKDFISFGHPFQWRCGHGYDSQTRPDNEISPIFLQFLDCTYQLVAQYPQYFEFSIKYILVILDHVYSCRFGTFLGNNDKEREQMGRDDCLSLWSYIKYNKSVLANPHYMNPYLEDTPTTHLLLPSLSKMLRNVTIWKEFFFRWSAVPSLIDPPHAVFKEIHDKGIMQPVAGMVNGAVYDKPLAHPDFDVPSMSSSDDSWEALYRSERRKREALQQQLDAMSMGGDNISTTEATNNSDSNSSNSASAAVDKFLGESSVSSDDFSATLGMKDFGVFLDGKDDFGLLSSSTPSLFEDEDTTRENVDLLVLASLNDKEKETTDDEGDHVADDEEDDELRKTAPKNDGSTEKKDLSEPSQIKSDLQSATQSTQDLQGIIEKQQEEIERLKALLLTREEKIAS